jgi:hypothetical protein
VVRRSFLAPAAYLLLPAALIALGVESFPVEGTAATLLALTLAGVIFSLPVLLGISRLKLWNVLGQLAPAAPSGKPVDDGDLDSGL